MMLRSQRANCISFSQTSFFLPHTETQEEKKINRTGHRYGGSQLGFTVPRDVHCHMHYNQPLYKTPCLEVNLDVSVICAEITWKERSSEVLIQESIPPSQQEMNTFFLLCVWNEFVPIFPYFKSQSVCSLWDSAYFNTLTFTVRRFVIF